MRRWCWLWAGLVFSLTLLIELPAAWVVRVAGLPLHDVSGSLWHGQARQFGPVGPMTWTLQPWRLQADAQLGFQGQGWQLRAEGWPWRWQLDATALGSQPTVVTDFRLAGQWQGALRMHGAGRQCRGSQGRVSVTDLALSEPWSLGLGQGWVEVDCHAGWHLRGQLAQQGEQELKLDADLLARRATVVFGVQSDAGLTALLRSMQWLGPQALSGRKEIKW